VALVSSAWPVREIWDCRETPVEDIDVDLRDRPDRVVVYRVGHAVYCESVDASEAQALALLLDGELLGEVNQVLASAGSDPTTISTWFARWMQLGLIVGCELKKPHPSPLLGKEREPEVGSNGVKFRERVPSPFQGEGQGEVKAGVSTNS